MGKTGNLHKAKVEKNDEFYTQFKDIEREIIAYLDYDPDLFRGKTVLLPCDDPEWSNFTKFFAVKFDELGLKKLISTSYAPLSKNYIGLFSVIDMGTPEFDETKAERCGKIFILEKDNNKDGRINYDDLEWDYLEGNGDFASEEVTKLRDEADFIITNPPFSKFREFIKWIYDAPSPKQFAILGNINAITYKEVFPYIGSNQMWFSPISTMTGMVFSVPEGYEVPESAKKVVKGMGYDETKYTHITACWYTNIEHGRRHEPLSLMNEKDNIKYNKKLKGKPYKKYDNFDVMEIPYTETIPSDYDGVMAVPITFLCRYCPEQFDIVTFIIDENGNEQIVPVNEIFPHGIRPNIQHKIQIPGVLNSYAETMLNGKNSYKRILIRHKRNSES